MVEVVPHLFSVKNKILPTLSVAVVSNDFTNGLMLLSGNLKVDKHPSFSRDTVDIVIKNQTPYLWDQHYMLLDAWKTCLLRKEEQRTRQICECDPGFLFVKLSRSLKNYGVNKTNEGLALHQVWTKHYKKFSCPVNFVYCPKIKYCVEETPNTTTLCPDTVRDRYWVGPTSGNEEFQLESFWSEKDMKNITVLGIDYRQGQWEYLPSNSTKWKDFYAGAEIDVMDHIRFTAYEDVPVISRILVLDSSKCYQILS
ncbi:uncharacterized protein LOC143236502 [Tachypleus tridentatus]|uniref:uncharacterized protein LOC143236502 n=1 Tax=Tachypleus tridentatus TaxID=6853 RepID=UPI003FD0BBE3